jgi:CubicO group peptidase (beta-lactamase class C family)
MSCARSWWAFAIAVGLAAAPRVSAAAVLDPVALAERELDPPAPWPEALAEPAPRDLQALRRRLAELVARAPEGGAAIALVTPQGMLIEGFGQARADVPMDAGALFRVGSLTKSFLSLAVMRLVEAGKLRLEDRVRDLAPEIFRNPWEGTHPLEVAHLLEHTSGFDEMRFNEIFDRSGRDDRPLAALLSVNPRSRVARWAPGTRFAYSQPGYTAAAYLIEKVSGMPYERYLEEQVFRPLGIDSARLRADEVARARLATGHDERGPVGYLPLLHRPALNLMISAQGMSRLLSMLLGRGTIDGQRFLTPESIARIERSDTLPLGAPAVRYGLGNWGDVGGRIPMRGHGGFIPGYQSLYRYSAAHGFGYAVLTNIGDDWNTLGHISFTLMQYLLAGVPPVPAPAVPQPPAVLARHAGSFRMAAPEVEFTRFASDVYGGISLQERDGVLWLNAPRRGSVPLIPTGPDTFRFKGQSAASIQFVRAAHGQRAVFVGREYYEEESSFWAWARKWAMELAMLVLISNGWVPFYFLWRRDLEEILVLARPLLAALALWGTQLAFDRARELGQLGTCSPSTIAVCVLSWAFGLLSYSTLARARLYAGARVPIFLRVHAIATAAAATWVALHLSRYGLIGLRTWRW